MFGKRKNKSLRKNTRLGDFQQQQFVLLQLQTQYKTHLRSNFVCSFLYVCGKDMFYVSPQIHEDIKSKRERERERKRMLQYINSVQYCHD